MKIISKYKDYYDHLQGVYGMDEKVVLDRTDTGSIWGVKIGTYICPKTVEEGRDFTFFILGKKYVIYRHNGKFYTKKQLHEQGLHPVKYGGKLHYTIEPLEEIEHIKKLDDLFGEEKEDWTELHSKENNCPILLADNRWGELDFTRWPKLQEFNFARIIPAEEMWIGLYTWLSKVAEITNTQTNVEKIEAHGFDKKTSFRPKIKI